MRLPLACALGAALLLAPGAAASPTQESSFMDDPALVFGDDRQVESTLATLRSLGVDRVRVSVLWELLAPDPDARVRPAFPDGGPADPASYPPAAWDRYDRVVEAARRHGLGVHFTVTGPGPLWASSDPGRGEPMWEPSPAEFRDFVTAVGRRYAGDYRDESSSDAPPGGPTLPAPAAPPPPPAPPTLPRVSFWSAWNEPNQPGWLRPQTRGGLPASPRLFRALQDAAWEGLRRSGHAEDVYLLAETAPRGSSRRRAVSPMRPLLFVRELYCVNRRLRPYAGRLAAARGCPADRAGRRRFPREHPGLFRATGWAHHPYALEVPPWRRDRVRDQVTMAVLGRLTRTLDRIFRRYGQPARLPLWLTEYGYQTRPPDPIVGVSWERQAAYLNAAEQIAYRNPRVRSTAQFLLVDDGPRRSVPPSSPRYWGSTFQSGLITRQGTRKPAFVAYQRPIDVTPRRVRRGGRLRVFGQLRPGADGAALSASVQFRRPGSPRWTAVRTVETRTHRNYLVAHVRAAASGVWRLVWRDPAGGEPLPSREVYVPVRGRRR